MNTFYFKFFATLQTQLSLSVCWVQQLLTIIIII